MRLLAVPSLPEIRLYTAHPASGLRRFTWNGGAPYWAYQWAGGVALARHILDSPEIVRGRRVLDLGAGSGIVGIAAAKSGAAEVLAAEIDPNAIAALRLNAEENGVFVATIGDDLTTGPALDVDVVLVGDLFYASDLAARVLGFLDRCSAAGCSVLVGDPGREYLPRERLELVAEYAVSDVGEARGMASKQGGVFSLRAAVTA
ncbi:MAG TPA: 50S ribosomal protein L11 methyltransferase [Rhizobiaceae bacterium]|nr:50S ribosomal protein L11 methyltransferase [Rhizobiaceae bacterium]